LKINEILVKYIEAAKKFLAWLALKIKELDIPTRLGIFWYKLKKYLKIFWIKLKKYLKVLGDLLLIIIISIKDFVKKCSAKIVKAGESLAVFNTGKIFSVPLCVSVFFLWLVSAGLIWERSRWSHLTFNELLNQILTPVEGTASIIMTEMICYCVVPAFVLSIGLFIFLRLRKKSGRISEFLVNSSLAVCSLALAAVVIAGLNSLSFFAYIRNQLSKSDFIESNYVSADDVEIVFPEKKRNLIFIWLESMEITYSDTEHGGSFSVNQIPKLTNLALKNECFNGNSTELQGGYALYGTTWTAGALFAYISGLPLQIPLAGSSMGSQESFFPGAISLGDILQKNGYQQGFLIGSDASFGGRNYLFQTHGDYSIWDYYYSLENKEIPENYHVWWGYDDKYLFENAKKHLLEMSKTGKPFNLSMLTVDTHFPNGYLCSDCDDKSENQYDNVIQCSDKRVSNFVSWVQAQSFYDNTTIVLVGDHPTMDTQYCKSIPEDFDRRVYVCVINPAADNLQTEKYRTYSSFDLFPTTLAAMGVSIEGNRLGLGVNLFSKEPSLLELCGYDYVQAELAKKNEFIKSLSGIDPIAYELSAAYEAMELGMSCESGIDIVRFTFTNLDKIEEDCSSFTAYADVMQDETRSTIAFEEMKRQDDGTYTAVFYKPPLMANPCFTLNIFAQTEYGRIKVTDGFEIDMNEIK